MGKLINCSRWEATDHHQAMAAPAADHTKQFTGYIKIYGVKVISASSNTERARVRSENE